MEKNIRSWVKGCLRCQQHKISTYTRTETTPFSQPSGRFETVHIDIICLLLPTTTYDGYRPNYQVGRVVDNSPGDQGSILGRIIPKNKTK